MRLIFIRHGDPDYENDTLTPKGKREALLLSERMALLNVKSFYCSPLGRARDTAKPLLEKIGRKAEILDWLMEFPGYIKDPETGEKRIPWDLMPSYWTSCRDLYDKDLWIETDIMKSGNAHTVYNEVCDSLDELLKKYGYSRDGSIYRVDNENRDTLVFFCHFGIECVLLSHILNVSPLVLWQGFVGPPSSVTTIITEEREKGIAYFRCNGFGDVSHLYAGNEPVSFAARFCENYSCEEERH